MPIFWSIQGDFIYRHHNEPRFNSACRREKHSTIPLKFIDVTRSTHADLDVLQEKRIDDSWNVDSSRHLSNSWKGFTKFTLLNEKPPKGFLLSGREIDKEIQTTTRPDHVWPEVGRKLVKPLRIEKNRNGQEKNQSSTMLEEWEEFTLSIQMTKSTKKFSRMRGENWKDLSAPTMPCKRQSSITKSGCKAENRIREEFQNNVQLYSGISWIHETKSRIFAVQKPWRSHCR